MLGVDYSYSCGILSLQAVVVAVVFAGWSSLCSFPFWLVSLFLGVSVWRDRNLAGRLGAKVRFAGGFKGKLEKNETFDGSSSTFPAEPCLCLCLLFVLVKGA